MFKFNEEYIIQKLKELLAIDSTTGYFRLIQNYLVGEMAELNIPSEEVHKGGLVAGHNVRHAAIGPGTVGSHGYERTHIDSLNNMYQLLLEYLIG